MPTSSYTTSSYNSITLEDLPTELLIQMISYLGLDDLKQAQAVCRKLRMLVAERLWANVELKLVDKREPAVRQDKWVQDIAKIPLQKRAVMREPWMVLHQTDIEGFFEAYDRGYLQLVLPAIKTINIVESVVETKVRRGVKQQDHKVYLAALSPEDLPRLKLMRVACAINGSTRLHFLRRFNNVEKYIWAQYSKPPHAQGYYLLNDVLQSTTSLNLTIGDIDESMIKSFGSVVAQLDSLQLTSKEYKCVLDASILASMLSAAKRLRQLTLARIEVSNSEAIPWLPDYICRLKLQIREDRGDRRNDETQYPVVTCHNVRSLHVNLMKGKDSSNLKSLEFTNLESLFFISVQRGEWEPPTPTALRRFDVSLFRSNPRLKRVVYNCASLEGLRALGKYCGQNLEILSFHAPVSRLLEVLLYDLDAFDELSTKCPNLRFLSLAVSPRHIVNPVKVVVSFLSHCKRLEEVYFYSSGKFRCKGINPMATSAIDDGYFKQYLRCTNKNKLYQVNIPVFKKHYCK